MAGVNNLRGLLFFELMFMSMRAMLSALFTFPAEFKMMLKVKNVSAIERFAMALLVVSAWLVTVYGVS